MSDSPRPVPAPPASATRFGDGGDYYRPGLATLEPEYVLAAWFYLAAEEEMPEIRAALRAKPVFRRESHCALIGSEPSGVRAG